ncbi:MAG TPA: sugar ABC transporter permease [Candidatus Avipropionibacterium avicola]|uniref:Sugar ABC transporter permease n=1 Tax=Candidatus Avipropionibacterium avicola TaxID=2840701 RepID=A0A9D1H0G7_9ACTN|nr:sugar ABC transporter permease [Candidatus Avipropionibacterium avicola]
MSVASPARQSSGPAATVPSQAPRPQSRRRRLREFRWWVPYLFMAPILVLFAVFFAWPAVLALQLAFYDYSVVNPTVWVGWDNFARMMSDARLGQAALNSLVYLVGLLPLTVVIPLLLAVLLNQKLRAIGVYRFLYYLPVVTSMVAVAVAWRYVFHDLGMINWMLTSIGLIDQPVQFLLDQDSAIWALILVEGWKSMGSYMLIYLAGLQAIPSDLYEAARIDGAGPVRRLRHVTVPLMAPYLLVTLTLEMQDATQVFTSIYVLTGGGPADSTLSLGYYIWSLAFEHFQMGYASAISLVLWLVLIVMAVGNYAVSKSRYLATS